MPAVALALRGLFAGAGSAMMSSSLVVDAVLELTGKADPRDVRLLYLGTASYDLEKFRTKQCQTFVERGVDVRTLDVARTTPPQAAVEEALGAADAVLVSGGNTLFAVERWQRAGLVEPLRCAMERGAVMCGGSAGAICWFDGGHSDSADPDWFRAAMLAGEGAAAEGYGVGPPTSPELAKPWPYVRVGGLGYLPGLCCPHHDRTQSNGVLRADDFDTMLLRHPTESALCIDHHAALVVADGEYRVLALDASPGSVLPGGAYAAGAVGGSPGVWLKRAAVVDGTPTVERRALSARGPLSEILSPSSEIVEDARVAAVSEANPSDDLED